MNNSSNVLVVLPALNEVESIAQVINSIKAEIDCTILVVDDGSTDNTGKVSLDNDAYVITHPINLGVGSAIRSALKYAMINDFKIVIQVDADGQHSAKSLNKMIDAINEGNDFVVGSRFKQGYKVSFIRKLFMNRLSKKISKAVNCKVTDSTSGYRAFSSKAINVLAPVYPSAYLSDTVEALLLAGDAKLKVKEINVEMFERQTGVRSAGLMKSLGYLIRLYVVILMHPYRSKIRNNK